MIRDQSILIVGTSDQVRDTLAASLKKEDYEVVTAVDPGSALILTREFSFDYIITDSLEECDVRVMMQIKALLPDVLILIAVDSNGGRDRLRNLEMMPFDGKISKPIKIREVKTALRLQNRRYSRRTRRSMRSLAKLEFKDAVRSFERDLIEEALQRSDWVKSKAARMLNINRTTLIEKMKRLNITL